MEPFVQMKSYGESDDKAVSPLPGPLHLCRDWKCELTTSSLWHWLCTCQTGTLLRTAHSGPCGLAPREPDVAAATPALILSSIRAGISLHGGIFLADHLSAEGHSQTFFLFFWPCYMACGILSFPTRDWTQALGHESMESYHGRIPTVYFHLKKKCRKAKRRE